MKTFHRLKKETGNAILVKYNYECTNCGSKENLCVHHVIKMKPDDEMYNDLENLTVLCRSCHLSHHRKEGDIVPNNLPPPGNPYGRRGKKPPIRCLENGCENWQHGKSLCKKHYEYKRRRGLL
jgi:5-methylcytosine-specific restriction endonuclease McrA